MKRSRFRKWAKWVGLVGCVVTVAICGGSFYVVVGHTTMLRAAYVGSGVLWINNVIGDTLGWEIVDARKAGLQFRGIPSSGIIRWTSSAGSPLSRRSFTIPLWIPFLALAIPTALLWRRDRRPSPNHCQSCGYNLTGNVSGVCPECGTERSTTKA